jgi:hypothetical protein
MNFVRFAALSCVLGFGSGCLGQPGDSEEAESEDGLEATELEHQTQALPVGGGADCGGWTGCYRFCTLAYQACQRREGANSPRCTQSQVNCLNTCDASFPQCW